MRVADSVRVQTEELRHPVWWMYPGIVCTTYRRLVWGTHPNGCGIHTVVVCTTYLHSNGCGLHTISCGAHALATKIVIIVIIVMAEQLSKPRTVVGVFLYVPNLIGYMRVLLSLYSLAVARTDYKTSVVCYALSFTCDYFDGFFARLCDQCTSPMDCLLIHSLTA